MKTVLLYAFLSITLACSITSNQSNVELSNEEFSGTWIRINFENQFELLKTNSSLINENTQSIEYIFNTDTFNTCSINHSEQVTNFYYACRWFLHGTEYPNLFITLEYKIRNNPNDVTFNYLYQVISRSENSITLKTIRQTF